MTTLFSNNDREHLRGRNIGQEIFVEIDHPTLGWLYYHGGVGRVTIDGKEYRGVTNPSGTQVVSVGTIEDRRFGTAVAVNVAISGANAAFMSEMKSIARTLEGRAANVYFGLFKFGTHDILLWKNVLPGLMTAPSLIWEGAGTRTILLTIESEDQARNFSTGDRWSPAGIRKKWGPDIKGFDFMGVDVKELRR